tara:strand:+ start:262 stop:510 length:249 start_codon:yes stop_codon:yes gene_type:complete
MKGKSMGLFDRRIDKAADSILKRVEAEDGNKGKYGNPIVVWIIGAILQVVIKKLLERIIETDGEDIKQMAHGLLMKIEEEDE